MKNMGPATLAKVLASDNGVEELMKQPVFENDDGYFSQAEMLADVINILRMDAKRMAAIHGVEVEIEKIGPDKVAWMLAQMVNGEADAMVEVFNKIEEYHHDVLEEALSEEDYQQYLDFKESQLYTVQPDNDKRDPEEVAAEVEQNLQNAEKADANPLAALGGAGGGDESD